MEALSLSALAKDTLTIGEKEYSFFTLPKLNDERIAKLPFSIRVLLESNLRNFDDFTVKGNTDFNFKSS